MISIFQKVNGIKVNDMIVKTMKIKQLDLDRCYRLGMSPEGNKQIRTVHKSQAYTGWLYKGPVSESRI